MWKVWVGIQFGVFISNIFHILENVSIHILTDFRDNIMASGVWILHEIITFLMQFIRRDNVRYGDMRYDERWKMKDYTHST